MRSVALIDWLKSGVPWGAPPDVVETHAAIIFLTGALAFKLKKPVDLGFLDFSTLEKRHAALTRELGLNRRTAPDLYLGLVPITEDREGFRLGGGGRIVDWLLKMKRFPADALLARRVEAGAIDDKLIARLAEKIAVFHDHGARIAGLDWPAAIGRVTDENRRDLLRLEDQFPEGLVRRVLDAREKALTAAAAALESQSAEICQGHGDLHLGNIYLDAGEPVLFDCIEFDDFYARVPPLYDLSFLLMDLLRRGLKPHANAALNAWLFARAREYWESGLAGLALLPLYLALHAEIRAKAEALRPGGAKAAAPYLDLALAVLETAAPRRLIAIGGLSGTGKSTLARRLAPETGGPCGAIHLRTDVLRKRIAGIPLTDRLGPEHYTAAATAGIYEMMERLASAALKTGASVILDAVFARENERKAVEALAAETGARFYGLWLEAPAEILRARIAARRGDASDANAATLEKQLAYDLGPITWTRVDVSGPPEMAFDGVAAGLSRA